MMPLLHNSPVSTQHSVITASAKMRFTR